MKSQNSNNMKAKNYNWLARLIDRITKTDCPNNNCFSYYGREVVLSSGTRDFVDVTIYDGHSQICFNFDFWTKELCLESYENYRQRDVIIEAFHRIYDDRFERVSIAADEPWDDDIKPYREMIGNDEYDQEEVTREYEELLALEAR